MHRATKIVATLGPASSSPEVLERMFRAGVDVVRLNFSHGTAQDHIDRAALVREVAQRALPVLATTARLSTAGVLAYLLTLRFTDGPVDLTGALTALLVIQASAHASVRMGLQ